MLDTYVDEKKVKEVEENSSFFQDFLYVEKVTKCISPKRLKIIFKRAFVAFKNYFDREDCDICFVWNGYLSIPRLFVYFSRSYGKKVYFFELSNIKGRFFMDHLGISRDSSLSSISLDRYSPNVERIGGFINEYKCTKERQHVPPQSRWRVNIKGYILDMTYNFLRINRYIYEIRNNIWIDVWWESRKKFLSFDIDKYDFEAKREKYIFFPLQVKSDTQIVLFSQVSLEESIERTIEIASRENLDILIKPHPAEKDRKVLNFVKNIKKYVPNLYLVNDNTFSLIKHSKAVVTINSTAGLEALMYHKPVLVLGESFYKRLAVDDINVCPSKEKIDGFLDYYIFEYLIEGDYFDPLVKIDVERVLKILQKK
ncbi:MAG: hypothetical protein JRI96_13335 [Deltaproteobacteria bacterium]|nr:hypothetical protein [Deltaproteobacteria bacterium]